MTLITFPSSPKPRAIRWLPPVRTQINTSGWSGASQAIVGRGALWRAIVEMPPLQGGTDERAWRAWLMLMRGMANTTRLPAVVTSQGLTGNTIRVAGGGQTGTTLLTDAWPFGPGIFTAIRAGDYFTLEGRLYVVVEDAAANSDNQVTLNFRPALVSSPADDAILEINLPYATMRLASDDTGWSEDISTTNFAFEMIEAR